MGRYLINLYMVGNFVSIKDAIERKKMSSVKPIVKKEKKKNMGCSFEMFRNEAIKLAR